MPHLTLQEVVDRINQRYSPGKDQRAKDQRAKDRQVNDDLPGNQPHRPEFYVPRITRHLAKLIFSIRATTL
ncbi:MAG: hypothetical protein ACRD23_06260 [Terriglobales bacterium]